jgi:phytoene dehydrogenase-like protein
MLLANRGFKVTVFEKAAQVGGRNAAIVSNGYKFDTGPTFLMMKFILDEIFEEAGRHIGDYLNCVKLEPSIACSSTTCGLSQRPSAKKCCGNSTLIFQAAAPATTSSWPLNAGGFG